MRRLLGLGAVAALILGTASTSQAKIVDWSGTLNITLGAIGELIDSGTGVATINGSAGSDHVNTIHFGPNDISGSVVIPLTDPENATLLSLVGSSVSVPTSGNLGAQTGTTISPKTMALGGFFKVCILLPGCGSYLPFPIANPITGPPFTRGVGIGGTATVNTFSKGPGLKVSLVYSPWTLGVKQMVNVSTNTNTPTVTNATVTIQGFKHGPASGTSSTAANSGVIQWVSPARVVTTVDPPSQKLAVPSVLRIHFIPEPGMLLLLASGVGGLVLLGRSRMRG
jgi:hypothetical protein